MTETDKTKMQVHNLLIIDESGSMSSLTHATLGGVNETLNTIREAQKQFEATQEHYVTIVTFDDKGNGDDRVRIVVDATPIADVTEFTQYKPWGNTPLYDAVGMSLTRLEHKLAGIELGTAVVTIITDGYENSSCEFNYIQVRDLIARLTQAGWTFSYMGSGHDVKGVAASLAIKNSLEFAHTEQAVDSSWRRERGSKRALFHRMHAKYADMMLEEEPQRAAIMRGFNDSYYSNRVTPARVSVLAPGEVFVFGSNTAGNHAGGAAYHAVERFGAIMGQGEGMQGQSYAIPTVGLDLDGIRAAVRRFVHYADAHPEQRFLVTAVGCGIAGYRVDQIAPMFIDAVNLENVTLPASFWKVIGLQF